jgi:hypothetical protein
MKIPSFRSIFNSQTKYAIYNNIFNVHGSLHRNNILVYKFQQDAHVTEFILSDNCSHVSGVTITHIQEHETILTTASFNRYTVVLSAAFVDEVELV